MEAARGFGSTTASMLHVSWLAVAMGPVKLPCTAALRSGFEELASTM